MNIIKKWINTNQDLLSFATLADLLAATPSGTMQATAYDAPGSMLYHDGAGKWAGSFGRVTAAQVAALQTAIASIAVDAEAIVPNAAVPSGLSRLRRGASVWAPPAGEPIALTTKTSSSPLALVTPGVTSLVQIWVGPVIPDYMIPDLLELETDANMGTQNTVTQANASMVGVTISGQLPTDPTHSGYMVSYPLPPASAFAKGLGAGVSRSRISMRSGGGFTASSQYYTDGNCSMASRTTGAFVSGAVRLYAMAKPGHVSDQVRFDRAAIYSKGNL